tara:strand:+ start:221091 stop:222269 length:1179 start_codon:yes stop_codon:yes gene_type:complete
MQNSTFILEDDQMMLVGVGVSNYVSGNLSECNDFIQKNSGEYIFGLISYDVKNQLERLTSNNEVGVDFPELLFVVPEFVIQINDDKIDFLKGESNDLIAKDVERLINSKTNNGALNKVELEPRISKDEYLSSVNKLKKHIQLGDIYEVTFCQEFRAEDTKIDPVNVYKRLSQITEAPFRCFVQWEHNFLLSGSPERFLKREGNKLFSQPIKGTAKRSDDKEVDEKNKRSLLKSSKEKAENVMIVDLVRNDLSRIAERNSVKVDELFGVYSFKTVHQLISTISADIESSTSFEEIIKALFPMGSMTGAPKIKAMELIEKYENFKRGMFSGSVGLIMPNGDFDFNVIIRSILYDQEKNLISCPVGGAITIQSDPEAEYEECLIKLAALKKALNP